MARIETEDQIEAGKTRRPYEDQDVIYFIHPTKWAVSRVLADYESRKRTVGGTSLLDKCFPCIFNGIESEVPGLDPMYHDCKILCVDGMWLCLSSVCFINGDQHRRTRLAT